MKLCFENFFSRYSKFYSKFAGWTHLHSFQEVSLFAQEFFCSDGYGGKIKKCHFLLMIFLIQCEWREFQKVSFFALDFFWSDGYGGKFEKCHLLLMIFLIQWVCEDFQKVSLFPQEFFWSSVNGGIFKKCHFLLMILSVRYLYSVTSNGKRRNIRYPKKRVSPYKFTSLQTLLDLE